MLETHLSTSSEEGSTSSSSSGASLMWRRKYTTSTAYVAMPVTAATNVPDV